MKRLHRILALLLVLTMCLSLLPLSALADEAEEEELAVGELEDPPETPEDGDEGADTFCEYAPDDEVTENNNAATYTVVEVYPEIEATCTRNGRLKGFKLSNGLLYLGDPPVDPVDAYQEASLTRTDSLVIPARHNCVLVDTATCIGSGVSYFECRYCHLHFKDAACTQPGENPSPKWKHESGDAYFAEVASTCVAPGNIAYSYCLNCGMMCDLDGNSLGYEDLLLPLVPHMLDHYKAVAPTCMMSGLREYWQCGICGKIFTDEAASTETTINDLVVPLDPDAHVWGGWQPVQAPTPTAPGISRRVCTLCGAEEIEVVPYAAAQGGTIAEIFDEALGDCYTQGNKAGFKLSDGSFYEGEAPGDVEEYIAPEALAAYTRVGSFADLLTGFVHRGGQYCEIAPICGECGMFYWECDVCHKRFRDSELTVEGVQLIPATGQHNWVETDRIDATDTTPGQVTYVCTICGAVKTESIPCTGIVDALYDLYYVIPTHDT